MVAERKKAPIFDYSQDFRKTLQWMLRDRHIMQSRQAGELPEYHDAVCRAATAVAILINNQEVQPIPEGEWLALRGTHRQKQRQLFRASFTIDVRELRKLVGLRDIPRVDELKEPDRKVDTPYITVIWQRPTNEDDFSQDHIAPENLVTAFPSILIDQVATTTFQQDYTWKTFGTESERQSLIDSFLRRLNEK